MLLQTILALLEKSMYLYSGRLVMEEAGQGSSFGFQLLRGSVAQLEWEHIDISMVAQFELEGMLQ